MRTLRGVRALFSVGLLFGLLLAAGGCGIAEGEPQAGRITVSAVPNADDEAEKDWPEVDRLVSEQKFEAAAKVAEEILRRAAAAGDEEDWTRALIRTVQLRTGLHGYETTVRFLRAEEWPASPKYRAVLNLFYAHSLVTYQRAYSWEIRQRERVDSSGEIDLKTWTVDQIVEEANRAFAEVWKDRAEWGDEPIGDLKEYIQPNSYPERIRGTLRDAVTYLWVPLFADTSLWRPAQSNDLYQLELDRLIAGDLAASSQIDLTDPVVHPLQKLAALLDDLELWHRRSERPEAALEARLERLRRLHQSFSQELDRKAIRKNLVAHLLEVGRGYEWWSVGQAQLAEFVRAIDEPDSLQRARKLALEGERHYPDSIGGRRCRHIVASIEAPQYSLSNMLIDGADRRSILVQHKNLERLHFRAYALDLVEVVSQAKDYNLLPQYREVEELIQRSQPLAIWSTELPDTPDFRQHRTYVTPPLDDTGLYVIVASARRDFARQSNREASVVFIRSDLVLLSQSRGGGLEVTVRSGETGKSLAGAQVSLYRHDYRKGHRRVVTRSSAEDGRVWFREARPGHSYFLLAERNGDRSVQRNSLYVQPERRLRESTAALIYTDRSVYRPLQELHWKVIAYRGGGEESRFRTLPAATVRVELVDANNEVVETVDGHSNLFGTLSGSFDLPAGRLLGAWHLRTSLGGWTPVRVEEYKRPTFEVTLLEPSEPLRLNRPAKLEGEARYYFGLPVTAGEVAWRVEREPVYPRWWGYWGWTPPQSGSQIVAAGRTALDDEGKFDLTFEPQVDERLISDGSDGTDQGVSYRYRLTAEVTDEGGETRSASDSYRLGFVAVEAQITSERNFFRKPDGVTLGVLRTDLSGVGRAGRGSWRLVELLQPDETLLPADQPLAPPRHENVFQTEGDRRRPRWQPQYSAQAVLRQWEDGRSLRSGRLSHAADGKAELQLNGLEGGAYRLHYATEDDFGAAFKSRFEFIVTAGSRTPLALPGVLLAERYSVAVGGTARLLVHSGLDDQQIVVETFRGSLRRQRRVLNSAEGLQVLEIPIGEQDRGGFSVRVSAVRDHQVMTSTANVFVPWDSRELSVEFASFRDRMRPGNRETWTIQIRGADDATLDRGIGEVLAYMYDRSLDIFAPHHPANILSIYPNWTGVPSFSSNLQMGGEVWRYDSGLASVPSYPYLSGDQLLFFANYGIGGPGRRFRSQMAMKRGVASLGYVAEAPEPAAQMADAISTTTESDDARSEEFELRQDNKALDANGAPATGGETVELRSDFSETAFWEPHLRTAEDGTATFEFTVPDSVTEWNVWVHAVTRDLRGGSLTRTARSVKELMVRPYLPRFLREGDQAELKVLINNAGEESLNGTLDFHILDPDTDESVLAEFGLSTDTTSAVPFTVEPGGGVNLTFPIRAPNRVGTVAFKVIARAGDFSDGELRPLPLLPSRVHLAQSRFVTLRDRDRRELHFADLAADDDPTRIDEQLVVTLDAQLFYSVLHALPYLVNYSYECTEQTLNRFLSTGIVSSLYDRYPSVARMAKNFSARQTRLETWNEVDPNRKMALEETPWLQRSRGDDTPGADLINVLDPRIAKAQRRAALGKLKKAQTSLGGFPWWPGGPPSPYMTIYLLNGFSRALEFDVEVPKPMVQQAWKYMHRHYIEEMVKWMIEDDCCWETITLLNFVLSGYPDDSWSAGVFTAAERKQMLEFSFHHWKLHSPLLKGYLALTLERADRQRDAELVFDSVMDSAKTTQDEGTFWAPEDRAWLWYNDTIETHAFALRVLTELEPDDARRHGLVQWLLLNKKLSHWKSTRATAEVIYSLIHYLEGEDALGVREAARVQVGPLTRDFVFEPEEYTGRNNQVVVLGPEIDPATMSTVVVEKETKGFLFASATWHFSTEELPDEARGDFFSVRRKYFRRVQRGDEWILEPISEGASLAPGEQAEVHLSLRTKHAAEYVHLRDPRAAGFEPETTTSRYKWNMGIGWYEEIRDSGTNFFFEWLPAGEYTFKYRLRANLAGAFRVGPATIQSMYAPEFTGYSSGAVLEIGP